MKSSFAAAHDVDRPIFYAVAVIIAGYLPIYVLSGPSGKLFHPMADTMSFALLGALILHAHAAAGARVVLVQAGRAREASIVPYESIAALLRRRARLVPRTSAASRMAVATLIFARSLLLIPFIGGEFMPHLDEGALWVRATMPYTISFEEASKIAPQIRDILMSFPQVTVVGSELGRPDDGTDPTGFFNNEFYVGLKPYDDKAWKSGKFVRKKS